MADVVGMFEQGSISHRVHTWQLQSFKVNRHSHTRQLLRKAAVYCYYTTEGRWIDAIELDPLFELPALLEIECIVKNVTQHEHELTALMKCYTAEKVFYTPLPMYKTDAFGVMRSCVKLERSCTLTRFFFVSEYQLIVEPPPGFQVHGV